MVEEEKKKALEIALKAVVDKFGRKLSKHKLFMNEGEIKKSGITMSEKKPNPRQRDASEFIPGFVTVYRYHENKTKGGK